MSLDDLLPILLVAAFVLNAVLRRRRSSGQGRGTPRKGAGTPGRADTTSTTASSTSSSTTASTSSAGPSSSAPSSSADDLAGRLEEARRRVQQASGGQQGPGRQSAGQQGAGQAAGRQGAGGRGIGQTGTSRPSAPPQGFLGREGTPPRTPAPAAPQPAGFLGREGTPAAKVMKRAPRSDAGRRTGRSGSATLPDALGLVGLEPDDVVRGLVWSEVLGRPASARLRRRKVSPRRSR